MAIRFDAAGDRLRVVGAAPSSTAFTWAGWVYFETLPTRDMVIAAMSAGDTDGYGGTAWVNLLIGHQTVNNVSEWRLAFASSAGGIFLRHATQITAGQWYFVAVGNDATDTVLYQAPLGTSTLSPHVGNNLSQTLGTMTEFKAAHGRHQFTDWLPSGHLRGLKVWSGARLTQTQLETEMTQFAPVLQTNLWAYYTFTDVASMLTDASGNGNTFTNPSGGGAWTTTSDPTGINESSGAGSTTGTVAATMPSGTLDADGTAAQPETRTGTVSQTLAGMSASVAGSVSAGGGGTFPSNFRVHFIGDSITEENNGWRHGVITRLRSAGYTPTPIGNRPRSDETYRVNYWEDVNVWGRHSGNGGWSTGNTQGAFPTWVNQHGTAELYVIKLGTNDIAWGPAPSTVMNGTEAATSHANMLASMLTIIPRSSKIIVVGMTKMNDNGAWSHRGFTRNEVRAQYNTAVANNVTTLAGQGWDISYIDTDPLPENNRDGVHPTGPWTTSGTGHQQMAVLIGDAVVAELGDTPSTTPQPTSGTVSAQLVSASITASESQTARGAVPAQAPARLTIGLFEDTGQTWMRDSARTWDIRYRYLAGPYEDTNSSTGRPNLGWLNNYGWDATADGAFARRHMDECQAQGFIPAYSYYELVNRRGPVDAPSGGQRGWEADGLAKLQSPSIMSEYFNAVRAFMTQAAAFGRPVYLLVEPDLLGFLDQHQAPNPDAYAAVSDSGIPELAGMPNTIAGWSQAFLRLKITAGASNVMLGLHVSGWATGTDLFIGDGVNADLSTHVADHYSFLAPCGILPNITGITYDVLVGDPLDRDAEFYWLGGGNGDRPGGSNRWWSTDDNAAINTQSFNRYREWLRLWNERSGLRWVLWQIPHGTSAQRDVHNDGTQGSGFRDNRPEYFFDATLGAARRQRWIEAGVTSLMFGAGIGTQTTHLTDNNYIRDNAVFGQGVPRGSYTAPTPVDGYVEPAPESYTGSVVVTLGDTTLGSLVEVGDIISGSVVVLLASMSASSVADITQLGIGDVIVTLDGVLPAIEGFSPELGTVQLEQLRARVRTRADMVGSNFVSEAEIDAFLQTGAQRLHDLLIHTFEEDYSFAELTFTTEAGVSQYHLPGDLYKLLAVDAQVDGKYVDLQRFMMKERNKYRNATGGAGLTPRYRVEGGQIRLYPTPTSSYPVTVSYAPELPVPFTYVVFPNGWEEYIVIDAAIKCLLKEESDTSALEREREDLKAHIISCAENRDAGSPQSAIDSACVSDDEGWIP